MTTNPPQRKDASNREDSDWDADTHTPAESQFEDMSAQDSLHKEIFMDTLEEPTVDSLWDDTLVKASVGPGSQDVVQIHMGNAT